MVQQMIEASKPKKSCDPLARHPCFICFSHSVQLLSLVLFFCSGISKISTLLSEAFSEAAVCRDQFPAVMQLYFSEVLSLVSHRVFSLIAADKRMCTCSSGIQIKMSVSEVQHWMQKHCKESSSADIIALGPLCCSALDPLRQVRIFFYLVCALLVRKLAHPQYFQLSYSPHLVGRRFDLTKGSVPGYPKSDRALSCAHLRAVVSVVAKLPTRRDGSRRCATDGLDGVARRYSYLVALCQRYRTWALCLTVVGYVGRWLTTTDLEFVNNVRTAVVLGRPTSLAV